MLCAVASTCSHKNIQSLANVAAPGGDIVGQEGNRKLSVGSLRELSFGPGLSKSSLPSRMSMTSPGQFEAFRAFYSQDRGQRFAQ